MLSLFSLRWSQKLNFWNLTILDYFRKLLESHRLGLNFHIWAWLTTPHEERSITEIMRYKSMSGSRYGFKFEFYSGPIDLWEGYHWSTQASSRKSIHPVPSQAPMPWQNTNCHPHQGVVPPQNHIRTGVWQALSMYSTCTFGFGRRMRLFVCMKLYVRLQSLVMVVKYGKPCAVRALHTMLQSVHFQCNDCHYVLVDCITCVCSVWRRWEFMPKPPNNITLLKEHYIPS